LLPSLHVCWHVRLGFTIPSAMEEEHVLFLCNVSVFLKSEIASKRSLNFLHTPSTEIWKENKHHIWILLIFQEFFVFCIIISVVVWISPLGFLLMNILWFNCTSRTYSYFKWKNDCSFMKIPGSLITRLKCTIWAHSMQFARNISNYLISNLNTTCISIAKVIWVIWEEIGTHQAKKKHPSSRKPLFPDHSEGFMQYLRSTCINE